MKKVVLFSLALCLLALPVNAKKPKLSYKQWFLMERQENKEKQPNDSISLSYRITHTNRYPEWPKSEMFNPQLNFIITLRKIIQKDPFMWTCKNHFWLLMVRLFRYSLTASMSQHKGAQP